MRNCYIYVWSNPFRRGEEVLIATHDIAVPQGFGFGPVRPLYRIVCRRRGQGNGQD